MMNIDFITATVLDGAFAAVAAIGFAIISNPPRKAILISAFLAAVGHGLRYFLMHAHLFTMDIATASFFAAFLKPSIFASQNFSLSFRNSFC